MKKYLIASSGFETVLEKQILKHKPDYVLYRDKENPHYDTNASKFVQICKQFDGVKTFIHQDVNLAKTLNATGVHLTSAQFDEIEYAKNLGLEVIVSTHTKEEVLEVQKKGADCVTYSPIFYSPHKGEPKGVEDLKALLEICSIKVFALGGIISQEQIEEIAKTNCYGFASIRYFSF
jgi:thiamine-phosphate pyrophosphorylase